MDSELMTLMGGPEGVTSVRPNHSTLKHIQVPAVVDEAMLKELEAMGFPTARATRALHFSGNSTVEGAINWLEGHEGDADLDDPLMVKKVNPQIGCSISILAPRSICPHLTGGKQAQAVPRRGQEESRGNDPTGQGQEGERGEGAGGEEGIMWREISGNLKS